VRVGSGRWRGKHRAVWHGEERSDRRARRTEPLFQGPVLYTGLPVAPLDMHLLKVVSKNLKK